MKHKVACHREGPGNWALLLTSSLVVVAVVGQFIQFVFINFGAEIIFIN